MYYFQLHNDASWYKAINFTLAVRDCRNILFYNGDGSFVVGKYVPRDKTRIRQEEASWILLSAKEYERD